MNTQVDDPIPTPWETTELEKAHNHRKTILLNCTKSSKLSENLANALLEAKEAEEKLTKYETLYNNALIRLKHEVNT